MSDDQPAGEVPDFDAEDEAIIDSVWDRIAAEEDDHVEATRPTPGPGQGSGDGPPRAGGIR